jgi:hypothetical protein
MHVRDFSTGNLLLWIGLLFLVSVPLGAQVTGVDPVPTDSVIIFRSPRPLIDASLRQPATRAAGGDLVFSGSGWGVGGFYQWKLSQDVALLGNFMFSPRRNTDEFDDMIYGNTTIVSRKVNRLYMLPIMLGLQYRLFSESLDEGFRPYVSGGFGPTIIFQTPYIKDGVYYEFFESWDYLTTYVRLGGYVGLGAQFGSIMKGSLIGVNMRYYIIPFGGEGLESMRGYPITDFGGIFLSITIGYAF